MGKAVDPPPLRPGVARTVEANTRVLKRVGARLPFFAYIAEIWKFRHFIFFDARSRVQSANNNDKLGSLWTVLNPILNGLSYYLIFGLLLQTSRGVENFIGFLIIGVFTYQLTARSVNSGARSISRNTTIIRAFTFPRATLTIATITRETMAFVPVIITMLAMVLIFPPVENITWMWLMIIPIYALQALFNLGLSLLLARWVAFSNDFSNIINFAMRIWMYMSGVFYSFDRYVDHPTLLAILNLNPLHQAMTMVRDSVLYERLPAWESWAILGGWAVGLLIIGGLVFWKAEESYGHDS
ncbi:ABC transporter permease [Neomicrococcus aestuarii]|uniref:Transport permease protein n=1 Tax=Neomicrococcus aestuarii TaxID=556325 RepID=A0A1L2ZL81_9MICC|nr:ABC transporter permease [Neomicrococcus aestuarii]APF39947.1 phosphate ABC transporter permease [Neomicrococcus aestuarii]